MLVILPVMMVSYWLEAVFLTDYCSKLKSVFSQVLFYEILEEMVLFCCRSKRERLISMMFSEKVGLARKALEMSFLRVLRNFL